MADIAPENIGLNIDPVLKEQRGYPLHIKPTLIGERPELFVKIKGITIKVVSQYLQLLWNANSHGKIINVQELILNSQTLFSVRFKTKDFFTIRHIASDLREISLFSDTLGLKKWYKNIDTERPDIRSRIILEKDLVAYLSEIVHLNYSQSHTAAKKISQLVKELGEEEIHIPDQFEDYFDSKIFDGIFENFCIIFVYNYYRIFSEFLYDEKG
jgi:hypothetical protein